MVASGTAEPQTDRMDSFAWQRCWNLDCMSLATTKNHFPRVSLRKKNRLDSRIYKKKMVSCFINAVVHWYNRRYNGYQQHNAVQMWQMWSWRKNQLYWRRMRML
jgi:hypothetical protein